MASPMASCGFPSVLPWLHRGVINGFICGFSHGFMWLPVCFALASSWLHRGFPLASPMASCGSLSVLSWLHHGFIMASPWLHPWLHVAPCMFALASSWLHRGFPLASPMASCGSLYVCLDFIMASPWLHPWLPPGFTHGFMWLPVCFVLASSWLHPWLHVAPCLFCLGFIMASPWLHSCFTWLPVCLIVASPWLPYS